jgi:hypothetical protein
MHACTLTRQRCDRSHGDCGHGLLRRSALIELARRLMGIQCRLIERGGQFFQQGRSVGSSSSSFLKIRLSAYGDLT